MAEICFENVGRCYAERWALRGFSACVQKGERVALMGPSGGGKTTLARLLMGLEKPDEGQITGSEGLRFCPVFQEDRLCPNLSAVENVALVLPRAGQKGVPAALAAVGLDKADIHKPVAALSGGQRRRVALVRAVEAAGDVLVLDEAFKGLDEKTKQLAFGYILAHTKGRTLLVITHDSDEANALCKRRVLL